MSDSAVLPPGYLIGNRYRIKATLGLGSSGQTYEAESVATGQLVALKRFRVKGAASWKSLELFEREARILAGLSHPRIPRHVESFSEETAEGPVFFLVQSLVSGTSLSRTVTERGPLHPTDVRDIAAQLLDVLAYLHSRPAPVIHRDIKPANVLLDAAGAVHLVDYGAVRALEGADSSGDTTVVGTYGFMAPEQYRGVATPASDLYGLGATIVFLLTANSPDKLPQKKLKVQLPPSLSIDAGFADWLSVLLEPAPEDRFQSATEAGVALRAGARRRGGSRTRVAILAGALAVIACGGGAAVVVLERSAPGAASASAPPPEVAPANVLRAVLPPPPRFRYPAFKIDKTARAHAHVVHDIAISPDGTRLVSASADASAKVWSADTLEPLGSLGVHEGRVGSVAFTPDGKHIVTGDSKRVRVFDAATNKLVQEAEAGFAVMALAVSADGSEVFAGGETGIVKRFALPGLTVSGTIEHSSGANVHALAMAPDNKQLAAGGASFVPKLWSTDGSSSFQLPAHGATIDDIDFTRDGSLVATASDDGVTRLSLTRKQTEFMSLRSESEAWSVAFSPDGTLVATGDSTGLLRINNATDGHLKWFFNVEERGIPVLRFSADGRRLYLGTGTGSVAALRLDDPADANNVPKPRAEVIAASATVPRTPAEQARALVDRWSGNGALLVEAQELAERALKANPNDGLALAQLGRITYKSAYIGRTRYDAAGLTSARAILEKAIAVRPMVRDAFVAMAWLELLAAKSNAPEGKKPVFDRAREATTALGRVPGSDLYVDVLLAQIASDEGNYDEAARRATRVIAEATDEGLVRSAFDALTDAYESQRRFYAADAAQQRIIELEPESAWEKGNYAQFLLNRGETAEAMRTIGTALGQMDYPAAHTTRAKIRADMGVTALWDHQAVDAAREHFDAALKDDPRLPIALYGRIAADAFDARAKGTSCDDCRSRLEALTKAEPEKGWIKAALARLAGGG
ncbi:MAG: protein kinase [Polyangiaceae bacterium]|nr:protein kinase [Polyangiaceae bacterium]